MWLGHYSKRSCTLRKFSSIKSTQKQNSFELPSSIERRVFQLPLNSTFNPAEVEVGWNSYWQQVIEEKRVDQLNKKTFSMILPPPNITGALHIGHALTLTIQDALARWNYMRGFNVTWVPGLDHAGIATQSVVERKLAKEGRSKHDLGRDAFIECVQEWNKQYGGRILHQIDRIGAIVNKSQSYFTLDPQRSLAVTEAFVQLHERGLVHRRRRMVNWSPTLRTAISDIEVETESLEGSTMKILPGRTSPVEFGVMHRIRYKVVGSERCLEVDTTRPETIFGDVAVAVHPDDERYKVFHGMHVFHPFSGAHIPVITDDILVDMELGTGVVKVTPAHDARDFECGLRHNLARPVVIDKSGKLCGDCVCPQFSGMDRFDARQVIIEELKSKSLYVAKMDHATTLSLCSRSGDVIEPLLMPQWFVDCSTMAKSASDHVRSGALAVEPKSHEHMWFYFLDNIRDWCVSRQLWWGHRIPAYRMNIPGYDDEWIVARSLDEARAKARVKFGPECHNANFEQDPDVLDTWFSSGLLPISVFGWPQHDPLLHSTSEYPLTLMETGSDILFFWVARMVMLCEELSGCLPFKRVLLHPMVRDKGGRKMSKSLGNVIDPIHVINGISIEELISEVQKSNISASELKKAEKELVREFPKGIPACGTDALRLSLASYLQQGNHINMDLQRVVAWRQFCNKMWNAVRFALPLLDPLTKSVTAHDIPKVDKRSLIDQWILSRLADTVQRINQAMTTNQLATGVISFQRFFVHDLCDVYIEFSKPILYGNRVEVGEFGSEQEYLESRLATQATLYTCLDYSMRLLHPFAPFVTEELWQRIRSCEPLAQSRPQALSILRVKFPEVLDVQDWKNVEVERSMSLVLDLIHAVRSLKHTIKILAPSQLLHERPVQVVCKEGSVELAVLNNFLQGIEGQCRVPIELVDSSSSTSCLMSNGPKLSHSVSQNCQVLFAVPNDAEVVTRVKKEIMRLQKKVSKAQNAINRLRQQCDTPDYTVKVPLVVQEQDTIRLTNLATELQTMEHSVASLLTLQEQL